MGKEIVYCDQCGVMILEEDFDRGKAATIQNRNYCTRCRPSAPPAPTTTATATPPPRHQPTPRPSLRPATPRPTPRPAQKPSTTSRIKTPGARAGGPFNPPRQGVPKVIWIAGGIAAAVLVAILLIVLGMMGGGQAQTPVPTPGPGPTPPQNAGNGGPTPAVEDPAEARARESWERVQSFQRSHPNDPAAVLEQVQTELTGLDAAHREHTHGYQQLTELRGRLQGQAEAAARLRTANEKIEHLRQLSSGTPSVPAVRDADTTIHELEGIQQGASLLDEAHRLRNQMLDALRSSIASRAQQVRQEVEDKLRRNLFFSARDAVDTFLTFLGDLQQFGVAADAALESEMRGLIRRIEEAEERSNEEEEQAQPEPTPTPPRGTDRPPSDTGGGEWTDLYNGGTDHAFRASGTQCAGAWRIENGELIGHCSGSGEGLHDMFVTVQSYTDYEMTGELRGDAGQTVFLVRFGGTQATQAPLITDQSWHRAEIRVRSNTATLWVDGNQILTAPLTGITQGQIGFALTPGATLRIRSVRVRPLP